LVISDLNSQLGDPLSQVLNSCKQQ
jgi:hypothetical protein